ncbi:uncharacterized protein B0T15DRAFT_486278 [Chaetomium strumarium]|uniref:FMN-dependent dehydrogenase domain-containing protein n=1 Tax=Chaetomium strumarium TaxID=1170767 RepID=A0AAJ0M0S3_9PEZI|nr:hypothetical protein B0T15DRAFT_486278 [Chaetomium strumarium]
MLVDTNARDTATATTTLFFGGTQKHRGHSHSHKVVAAPIGFAHVGHQQDLPPRHGKLAVARAPRAELKLAPIESVPEANGAGASGGVRFFQLYMPHDDELTVRVLFLTVDTWQLGWRHDDVATSNYAFYHGIGAELGLSDPVFQKRLKEKSIDPVKQPDEAGALWIDNVWHGRAHTWEKVKWVMGDAKRAVEIGCDGIVVSNHAGRHTSYSISGIRGASDVFKALALGAKFVFHGVRHVMKSLLADFDILLNVAGFQSVDQIDRTALESYPRGYPLLPEKSKL